MNHTACNNNKGNLGQLRQLVQFKVKFMFSKKAIKIDEIFAVDLTLYGKCQIDGEDLVNFCVLLREHEL